LSIKGLSPEAVSPDGRWVVAGSPRPSEEHTAAITAIAVDGSQTLPLCLGFCWLTWATTGKFLYIHFPSLHAGSYPLPVLHDTGLPKLPPSGIARLEDLTNAKTAAVIPQIVESVVGPSVYAYTRQNTRRNLYRIQLL
jgi:hypothetical protein